jgi:hypothetical protein
VPSIGQRQDSIWTESCAQQRNETALADWNRQPSLMFTVPFGHAVISLTELDGICAGAKAQKDDRKATKRTVRRNKHLQGNQGRFAHDCTRTQAAQQDSCLESVVCERAVTSTIDNHTEPLERLR